MIVLTRQNGSLFALNDELIEIIEEHPDTTLKMTDGKVYIVSESMEEIIEKIIELIKAGKLKEVSDIRDETDLKGLKVTIDLKKGTDPGKLMEKLYKMTPLQDSFGCNFNVLVEGSPMVLGVADILSEWLRFRKSCIKRSGGALQSVW